MLNGVVFAKGTFENNFVLLSVRTAKIISLRNSYERAS